MATELGQAYVQIMPSAKGISNSIKKELDPESAVAGKSAGGKIAMAIKGVITAAAIGKTIGASIKEGAALQQSLGGVETLFKENADKVKKYANEAYKTAGLSANAYMENVTSFSASLLQSLGGDTEKAANKANMAMVDMSDNANKMGTDMQSIQNAYQGFAKQNYTMLDNLKLGYGGTKSEMERLLADATKLTGVKYDINNLSDVYDAIHAVQQELGITGTTAKEASETLSGSFAAMKGVFKNVLGGLALGQDIRPALQGLAETTATFLLGNFLPMVGNILKGLPIVIGTFFKEASPYVSQAAGQLLSQLGITFSSSMTGIFSDVQTTISPLIEGFRTAFSQLPSLFQTVASAITPIIESIVIAFTRLDFSGIQAVFSAIVPAITNAFSTMMAIVRPAIDMVVNSFVKMWNAAQPLISILASALMPVLQVLGAFIGGVLKGVLIGVSAAFDAITKVIGFLTPVISVLVNGFKAITPVLTKVAEWVGTVIGVFTNLGGSGTTLKNLLSNAWGNIKSVVSMASSGISGAISIIKSIFSSLGTAGGGLKGVLSAAWNGIRSAISTVGSAISGIINGIKSVFSALGSAGNSLKSGISGAWNGMKSVVTSVGNSIKGVVNSVKNVFNSLKNINISGAGAAIMNGFLNGLKGAYEGVKKFVGGIADWIKKNKGPISYDKKLLIPAGNAIMTGLDEGLKKQFKSVQSTVGGMADSLAKNFGGTISIGIDEGNNEVQKAMEEMLTLKNTAKSNTTGNDDEEYNMDGTRTAKGPITLILKLGNRSFKAFVEDVSNIQNREIELEEIYGI